MHPPNQVKICVGTPDHRYWTKSKVTLWSKLNLHRTLNDISTKFYVFQVNDRNSKKGANILKVNNKNTRTTSVTLFWCFIVNFEHISYLYFYCWFWTSKCLLRYSFWLYYYAWVLFETATGIYFFNQGKIEH